MSLRLITAPAVEPISLEQAKAHLRVDHSDDDGSINLYIQAARSYAEIHLGRALVTQTWELVLDEFPDEEIKIPKPPLQSVTHIKYDDDNGLEQTVDPSTYTVDAVSAPGWVMPTPDGWPNTFDGINSVRIRFVAGYPPSTNSPSDLTSAIPPAIIGAMLLIIGSMYANREIVVVGTTASKIPWGVSELLVNFRVEMSMA